MPESKIPNIVFSDGNTTIGFLKTHQDFLNFHVENQYCIQNPRRFEAYQRSGYMLYIIDNGMDEPFLRYAIVIIKKGTGDKTYWGMDDIPMDASGQREFENTLSPKSIIFINNLCANLKDENKDIKESKYMKKNRTILTEAQLIRVIKNSVKKVLREAQEMGNKTFYLSNGYAIGDRFQASSIEEAIEICIENSNGQYTANWLYMINDDGKHIELGRTMRNGYVWKFVPKYK